MHLDICANCADFCKINVTVNPLINICVIHYVSEDANAGKKGTCPFNFFQIMKKYISLIVEHLLISKGTNIIYKKNNNLIPRFLAVAQF